MSGVKKEIIEKLICVEKDNGQTIQLNVIKRGKKSFQNDLRVWNGEKALNGFTLSDSELSELCKAINQKYVEMGINPSSSVRLGCKYEDVVFEDDTILVTYKGIYKFSGLFAQGYRIRFVIENKTNQKLRIQGKNISVNGFVVTSSDIFNSEVETHKKVIDTVLMGQSNLHSIGVKNVFDMNSVSLSFEYEVNKEKIRTAEIFLEPYEVKE